MPPEEPQSQLPQEVRKGRFRRFFATIRDAIFELFPGSKPIYKWFAKEGKGMKDGWFLFSVVALIIAILSSYITFKLTVNTNNTFHDDKMMIKPKWDNIYARDYADADHLFNDCSDAFDAEEYGYCKLFYEQNEAISPSSYRKLIQIEPIYIMAKFATSPQAGDSSVFQNGLNLFVADLQAHKDNQVTLAVAIYSLGRVSKCEDAQNQVFIKKIVDEITKIKATAPE